MWIVWSNFSFCIFQKIKMDADLEKSIRRIVSESNVNVITKRMVRAEYMRQHNVTVESLQLKEAINQVLHTIVQEMTDLLKQGHSLESLKLSNNVDCLEADKSCSLNTPRELKDLDKSSELKDLDTHREPKDLDAPRDLKDLNTEAVEGKVNPEHLNRTPKAGNQCFSSKKNESSSTRLKTNTLKKKNCKIFSAEEVRNYVTLSDSEGCQNSQVANSPGNFSPLQGFTLDHTWEEDIALLSPDNDSNTLYSLSEKAIPRLGHECEQRLPMGPNCFEVSSPGTSESSVGDSADVIVIDSSPEKNYPDRTKSRSADRNWLSLFSEEEVRTIMADDGLAYNRDSCDSTCDEEPASSQLYKKCTQNLAPNNLKISEETNSLFATSPAKKKKKTTVVREERNGIDALLRDHDTFSELKDITKGIYLNSNRTGKEAPSETQVKSTNGCEKLSVSVKFTPLNADNVETIIDLTK